MIQPQAKRATPAVLNDAELVQRVLAVACGRRRRRDRGCYLTCNTSWWNEMIASITSQNT